MSSFELIFGGHFKNQQDLVNQIMQVPGSDYYATSADPEQYRRIQNRLKAYISQLLSPNVNRIITEEFKRVLTAVILRRVNSEGDAQAAVNDIINKLRAKKITSTKNEQILKQLTDDVRNSRYISIITAKPLEVEADITEKFSLRRLVFQDILDSIYSTEPIKEYRFNFPTSTSGSLFWKGVNKLFVKYLKSATNIEEFLQKLKSKINVDIEMQGLFKSIPINNQDIHETATSILRALRKQCIAVFHNEAPIYTLPLIVIDPAETKTAKVYMIIDDNENDFDVYKLSQEEVLLWRIYVWDKITIQKSGKPIEIDQLY